MKTSLKPIIPLLALSLAMASSATAMIAYLILALSVMSSYSAALKALFLAWLIGALNPGLSFGAEANSLGRPLIYLAAAVSVFGRAGLIISKSAQWPLALGALLIVHSLFFSAIPDVSILKAVLWALVTGTIFQAFSRMTQVELQNFTHWLLVVSVVIMIISWPLLATPIGFLRNSRGFQGVLNHPQTYGIFLSILAAFIAAKVFGEKNPPFLYFAILGLTAIALFLSQARTGAAAFLGGLFGATIFLNLLRKNSSLFPVLLSGRIGFFLFLTAIVAVLSIDIWSPLFRDFLFKGYDINDVSMLYEASRGSLVESSLISFRENPLMGVGFGIETNREMNVVRDPFFGFPISAPIEKGNAYIATLEEVGIIISATIFIWLLCISPRAIYGGVIPLTIFFTALFVNIGEAVLFSPGGNGLLILLFLGWSVHQPPLRKKTSLYD